MCASGRPGLIARTAAALMTRRPTNCCRGSECETVSSCGRKVDAAFVFREEEIWARGFPAVVNPKPIFGRLRICSAMTSIGFGGEGGNGIFRPSSAGVKTIRQRPRPFGEDGGADDGGLGPFGEERGERRGGSEPTEERRPQSVIARMLIRQDAVEFPPPRSNFIGPWKPSRRSNFSPRNARAGGEYRRR